MNPILQKGEDFLDLHWLLLDALHFSPKAFKQIASSYGAILKNNQKISYFGTDFEYDAPLTPFLLLAYPAEILFLDRLIHLSEITSAIDVGANIGQWPQTLLTFFPHVKVYSFEPDKRTFRILSKNVIHFPQWHAFPAAVGNPNDAFLYLSPVGSAENSLKPRTGAIGQKIPIKTVALTPLGLKQLNIPRDIDLLKIDAEGYEIEALSHCTGVSFRFLSVEIPLQDGKDAAIAMIRKTVQKYWKKNCELLGVQQAKRTSPVGNAVFAVR